MSKGYSINGREVYSSKGRLVATLDADGSPVMAPGMAGPHTKGVLEFLGLVPANPEEPDVTVPDAVVRETSATETAENPPQTASLPVDGENPAADGQDDLPQDSESSSADALEGKGKSTVYVGSIPASKPEGEPETVSKQETVEEWEISTIPEDLLPPFSKEYGTNTPGFREYVNKHKLTVPQVSALVKRLENR